MYHAACKVLLQPLNRSYSQLTFSIFSKYVVLALGQLVHLCPFPLYPALLPMTSTTRGSRAKVIMRYTGVLLPVLFMLVLACTSWSIVAGCKGKPNHSLLLPFLLTVLFVMLYTYSLLNDEPSSNIPIPKGVSSCTGAWLLAYLDFGTPPTL